MAAPVRNEKSRDITALLRTYQAGDQSAFDELVSLVYEQLKYIARNQMSAQRGNQTLSSTGLVHEAFMKLKQAGSLSATDRSHFFAIAARTMRWVLMDYAKSRKSLKRGGENARVTFDEKHHTAEDRSFDPFELNEALEGLEAQDPRACRVFELRQLVGLSVEETAAALKVSEMTVKRDWTVAKLWLSRRLGVKLDK